MLVSGLLTFFAAGLTAQAGLDAAAARATMLAPELQQMVVLWSSILILSAALNLAGMLRRARADGQPLAARLGRRVLFAMLPALAVGGALTLAFAVNGGLQWIFSVWMLCYGAALIAASAHSLTSVRLLGVFTLMAGALGLAGLDLDFILFVSTFGAGHFLLGAWVGVRYGW